MDFIEEMRADISDVSSECSGAEYVDEDIEGTVFLPGQPDNQAMHKASISEPEPVSQQTRSESLDKSIYKSVKKMTVYYQKIQAERLQKLVHMTVHEEEDDSPKVKYLRTKERLEVENKMINSLTKMEIVPNKLILISDSLLACKIQTS